MTLITPEELADLEAKARAATPGPWESDTLKSEGSYGSGEDVNEGFMARQMFGSDGRAIFDSLNSDAGLIREEMDEDGVYAWDEVAEANFAHIAANAPNVTLRLIATIRAVTARAEAAEKERDELREALRPIVRSFSYAAGSDAVGMYRVHGEHLFCAARLLPAEPDHG